jgi:hypothetical protein
MKAIRATINAHTDEAGEFRIEHITIVEFVVVGLSPYAIYIDSKCKIGISPTRNLSNCYLMEGK